MANKYIIHSAAFNGDGTSSAEATSNGGVGAWNNINIFEGTTPTYGALAAGDVVYIRSKDAAGADITRTLTASVTLGGTAAVATNRIAFLIDSGAVWPGVDGDVSYLCPSSYVVSLRAYNRIKAMRKGALKITEQNSAGSWKTYGVGSGHIDGAVYDLSEATTGTSSLDTINSGGGLRNCLLRIGRTGGNSPIALSQYHRVFLHNVDIELVRTGDSTGVINAPNASELFWTGGRIFGPGTADRNLITFGTDTPSVKTIGVTWPLTMPLPTTTAFYMGGMQSIGVDSGLGALVIEPAGRKDSRDDGNYPTLNAVLPGSSANPWSWQLLPRNAQKVRPLTVELATIYTENDAQKSVVIEFLVASTFAPTAENVWIDATFIDSSGTPVGLSSFDPAGGALQTSAALWEGAKSGNDMTYGPVLLKKYKISLPSGVAVKKDTMVVVQFSTTLAAATNNDLLFVCPEVVVA